MSILASLAIVLAYAWFTRPENIPAIEPSALLRNNLQHDGKYVRVRGRYRPVGMSLVYHEATIVDETDAGEASSIPLSISPSNLHSFDVVEIGGIYSASQNAIVVREAKIIHPNEPPLQPPR